MPTVPTAGLAAGAVLSQPVFSPRGILLASAGTTLTEAHLAIFSSWGVLEATIVGDDADAAVAAGPDPGAAQAIGAEIEERFSLVTPMSPFMRELRRVVEELLVDPAGENATKDH